METTQEQALIERSRGGEVQAFNLLVEAYQDQVYSVALRMVRSHAPAEDLVQEAFISAFRSLRQYRGGSFRAWLLRIVRNTTYDWLRQSQRRPVESIDENVVTFEAQLTAGDPTPEEAALNAELGTQITRVLGHLQLDQRLAIVLVDVEGYSYEDAAEAIGASVGTVKSRLSRARSRMRDALLQDPELLPSRYRPVGEGGNS